MQDHYIPRKTQLQQLHAATRDAGGSDGELALQEEGVREFFRHLRLAQYSME